MMWSDHYTEYVSPKFREMESLAMRASRQNAISLVGKREGCTLLDIGCSRGRYTAEFAKQIGAAKVYGIDISEDDLAIARERGVDTVAGNIDGKLPFDDNFFDVVLCHQTAEHLIDPDNLFEEIRRILKDDGQVVIAVPNLCSFHNRVLILLGFHPTSITPSIRFVFGGPNRGRAIGGAYARHMTAFSPRALKEMLEFYGFKVREMRGAGFYPFGKVASKILSKMFPTLSVHLIVVAEKSGGRN